MINERCKNAILTSLAAGLVPATGLEHLAVGRRRETEALLADIEAVGGGGSSFRIIEGPLGAGKTFMESLARQHAQAANLVVAHADFSATHRLHGSEGRARALYSDILARIFTKNCDGQNALQTIIETWISSVMHDIPTETTGEVVEREIYNRLRPLAEYPRGLEFAKVLQLYHRGYANDNVGLQDSALRWLRAEFATKTEAYQALGVRGIINDSDLFMMLKLFGRFVRLAGYGGFYVILDELSALTDRLPNAKAREGNYALLLQIINECVQSRCTGLGFLIAGTKDAVHDKDRGLFAYAPLRSRLESMANPGASLRFAPVIPLDPLSTEELLLLLTNIVRIHSLDNREREVIPVDGIRMYFDGQVRANGNRLPSPRELVRPFIEMLMRIEEAPGTDWRQHLPEFCAPRQQAA